jgi:hypothetical protein
MNRCSIFTNVIVDIATIKGIANRLMDQKVYLLIVDKSKNNEDVLKMINSIGRWRR